MAKGKPTYAGRISNAGAQFVEAPIKPRSPKGKTEIMRGEDLRARKNEK